MILDVSKEARWWFQMIFHVHLGSLAKWSNLTTVTFFQRDWFNHQPGSTTTKNTWMFPQGDARSVADWQLLQLPVDGADGVRAEPLSAESFTERVQGPMASVESSALAKPYYLWVKRWTVFFGGWLDDFSPGPPPVCVCFFFVGLGEFLGVKGVCLNSLPKIKTWTGVNLGLYMPNISYRMSHDIVWMKTKKNCEKQIIGIYIYLYLCRYTLHRMIYIDS